MSKIEDAFHSMEMDNVNVDYLREQFAKMQKALGDARLLCANLYNGGHGHMTLVGKFQESDAEVDD